MSQRSPITTHALDTSTGRPAAGLAVALFRLGDGGEPHELARGETDANGRIESLLPPGSLKAGSYRLCFDTGSYFSGRSKQWFYPVVQIDFMVGADEEHYHLPLLLSPYGYSTYRGS